jgi:hypothetical protein
MQIHLFQIQQESVGLYFLQQEIQKLLNNENIILVASNKKQ